jgi:hypothetical protein
LYPPESSDGRLGLLELRAFEMPPHPRMSLAQQLLVRALVSRFWRKPYTQPLVPWGTDIHDRWMLPHFVWDDFCDVIEDLRHYGYAMQCEWFEPHFEFRFPQYGDLDARNIHLEIRQALEPWHVLGEEPGPGGTAASPIRGMSLPPAAGRCRCIQRASTANMSAACAIGPGSRPIACIPPSESTRRWFLTWSIRGTIKVSEAAPIT